MSGDVNFQGTNEEWTEFVKRINKEKKRLITEIMEDDAKDGIYHTGDTNKMVTAVEWLRSKLLIKDSELENLFEQAKAMEKDQIINAAKTVLFNSTGQGDTAAEQYYNETYGK
jgi:hypothetical protein